MNIFQILCILLFVTVTVTNIVFIIKKQKLGRQITKGFITGSLLLYLICSKEKDLILYFGLIASLAGDILLLFKEKKLFFTLGASCFALTHISYFIVTTKVLPTSFNWCYYGIVILLGYLVVEFLRKILTKSFGKYAIPASIYFYILSAVILNLLCGTLFNFNIIILILLIGSLCFIGSDIILSINFLVKKIKNGDILVLLLYALAQFLIIVSVVFL